ncbi:hypothetical protein SBA1_900007 [Candidatus Sulfotelmatobacter kueseliae]|uniref:Uncharacterized protein n=1 Tax=Candidatus Sulfotelmatobacter kueseliae TaxID=2042962 RepID=A0A2U3LBQ9_9BACT|nr:hypothetical protein SBA1_900007 [Candidatus Sulfotelmatobacter kueseliae]
MKTLHDSVRHPEVPRSYERDEGSPAPLLCLGEIPRSAGKTAPLGMTPDRKAPTAVLFSLCAFRAVIIQSQRELLSR